MGENEAQNTTYLGPLAHQESNLKPTTCVASAHHPAPFSTWPTELRLGTAGRRSLSWTRAPPVNLNLLDMPLPHTQQRSLVLGCIPFFLARVMMSAALLLITLVMYTGQLIRPAMVMARNTASASSCGNSEHAGQEGRGGGHHPP